MEKSTEDNEFKCHAASSEICRIVVLQCYDDILQGSPTLFCKSATEVAESVGLSVRLFTPSQRYTAYTYLTTFVSLYE
jgi:hypothetical protein